MFNGMNGLEILKNWPRFDDGELVEIGDDVIGPDYGERINVHDITFHANGFTLRERTGFVHWYESDDRFKRPKPYPIGADGLPIKKGETVFDLCRYEYIVDSFDERFGLTMVSVHKPGCDSAKSIWATCLTHTKPEPPDSWERLEHDAEGIERDCGGTWHKPDGSSVNVLDLVRRAKELAEKEAER